MPLIYVWIFVLLGISVPAMANGTAGARLSGIDYIRATYTAEHPLVYEDAWEKWPYAFINDDGEPTGYNVELVREVLTRLRIPYQIRLVSQSQAHKDLLSRKSHLTFGVYAPYNSELGQFGKETVSLFENSLFQLRRDSTGPIEPSDLRNHRFHVVEDSRAYYYIKSLGVPDSTFIVVPRMDPEIFCIVAEGKGEALWNTMMMKWVINKYHLTDYCATPVNIPAGEYRMISHDTELLNVLDSVCRVMKQEGRIEKLTNQWMYPEKKTESNSYVLVLLFFILGCFILMLVALCLRHYRKYYSRTSLTDVNMRMDLILHANKIKVWVYYPQTRRYAWMNRDGKVETEYSSFEFSQFYPDGDFNIIHTHVMEFLVQQSDPVVVNVRSYKLADRSTVLDAEVHIQALYDDYGKLYLVCGTQHDITDSKAAIERMRLLHQRYKTAFNVSIGGIMRFDADGIMTDVNQRVLDVLGIDDRDGLLAKRVSLFDFAVFRDMTMQELPNDLSFCSHIRREDMSDYVPFSDVRRYKPDYNLRPADSHDAHSGDGRGEHAVHSDDAYFYVHFMKSYDTQGNFICFILFIRDMTVQTNELRRLMDKRASVVNLEKECRLYKQRRDYTLRESKVWMLRYYPDSKRVVFYDRAQNRMQTYSQLQVIEFVDGKYLKRIFKLFHKIDSGEAQNVHMTVSTVFRSGEYGQAHFRIDACPIYDHDGHIMNYFGICTDITSFISMQRQLKNESDKAREAEMLKQNFLRNMSYSIRHPLVAMQQAIEKLSFTSDADAEAYLTKTITGNAQKLIALSDDTLLFSRIEAGMYSMSPEIQDFVPVFKECFEQAVADYKTDNVVYNVADTYTSLMLNFDKIAVSRVLKEAIALSARHTQYGSMYVRYMYHSNMLTIAVEDTGQGLPPGALAHLFDPYVTDSYISEAGMPLSGLEMPICKALVEMMHGSIDVESGQGRGITIYISIPIE